MQIIRSGMQAETERPSLLNVFCVAIVKMLSDYDVLTIKKKQEEQEKYEKEKMDCAGNFFYAGNHGCAGGESGLCGR